MLVHSGANTHIINIPSLLHDSRPLSSPSVGSLFGSHDFISHIGSLPIIIGDINLTLQNVRFANKAKTSCLGLVALKSSSHCINATHEINEFLHIRTNEGTETTINKSTLRTINALDYVPVVVKSWTTKSHVNAIRRSARTKSIPSRLDDYVLEASSTSPPANTVTFPSPPANTVPPPSPPANPVPPTLPPPNPVPPLLPSSSRKVQFTLPTSNPIMM